MSISALSYLRNRFSEDASALRQSAESLRAGNNLPGPDAAASERMMHACEKVISLIDDLGFEATSAKELLTLLEPVFEKFAISHQSDPPVRSVFSGATVRLRELVQAENAKPKSAPSNNGEKKGCIGPHSDNEGTNGTRRR